MRRKIDVLATLLAFAVVMAHPVFICAGEPTAVVTQRPWLPDLDVDTYKLANGLTVVFHEDHTTPLVTVNVIYNVGSKDDPPGKAGFAHLFEHLMFEGSLHHDAGHAGPIYASMTRADSLAWTERDRTVYHETVTRNALERTLWLEAERMGFLLPAVTPAKFQKVRQVVKLERWQNHVEPPLSEMEEAWTSALYPPGHPYRQMVIGTFSGLTDARLADVAPFFHKHYSPSNAFLCLAGDFEPIFVKHWIQRYFGPLEGSEIAPPRQPDSPKLAQPRCITLTDRVSHARAALIWPTVPANHPDEAALDVLAAVLGGGTRSSRLYRSLCYDGQLATQVGASHPTYRLAGTFQVDLIARPGQKLDRLIELADREIERLKQEGPTAEEVRGAKIERRRLQIGQLESLVNKAALLNHYASELGDPLAYRSVLSKVFAVTPDDVRRVARAYLGSGRIELEVHPGERSVRSSDSDSDPVQPEQKVDARPMPLNEGFERSVMPENGPVAQFNPPLVKRYRLSNGLELRIVERHKLPAVILKLIVKTGETSAPRGKEGLASLTLDMMAEGTKSRGSLQLEADLSELGSSVSTVGSLDSSTVTLTTVTRYLEPALDLFADVVLNPAFEDKEFLRLKLGHEAFLLDRTDDAVKIAEDVFPRLFYHPDHPYARPRWGTIESVRGITLEDVVAFYRWVFVPNNATLVVVGDVRPGAIAAALEARLGGWSRGPLPASPDLRPLASPTAAGTIYLIDKPGADQSVVSVGRIGASVKTVHRCLFDVLGKKLSGRINWNLAEEKALAYEFSSRFDFRNGAGPFVVSGSVLTLETRTAITQIVKEMSDLAGPNPVSDEEVAEISDTMIPDLIDRFGTNAGVAAQLAYTASHRLPANHFASELARFAEVTKADLDRLAQTFLKPRRMTVLVVGDRAWIEPSLKTLPFAHTIRVIDREGRPLSEAVVWRSQTATTAAVPALP